MLLRSQPCQRPHRYRSLRAILIISQTRQRPRRFTSLRIMLFRSQTRQLPRSYKSLPSMLILFRHASSLAASHCFVPMLCIFYTCQRPLRYKLHLRIVGHLGNRSQDQCSSLGCMHTFHDYCLERLSEVQGKHYFHLPCPTCRQITSAGYGSSGEATVCRTSSIGAVVSCTTLPFQLPCSFAKLCCTSHRL